MWKRILKWSRIVTELFVAFLMFVSSYQAIVFVVTDQPFPAKVFAETILSSVPVLGAAYFIGALLIVAGIIFKRSNIIANGMLIGVAVFSYTVAVESYLAGYTIDTIDITVLTLMVIVFYFIEKRRYRQCLEEQQLA